MKTKHEFKKGNLVEVVRLGWCLPVRGTPSGFPIRLKEGRLGVIIKTRAKFPSSITVYFPHLKEHCETESRILEIVSIERSLLTEDGIVECRVKEG